MNIGIRAKADKAVIKWVQNAPQMFRDTIVKGAQSVGFEVATRAQANAPIDTGDLRRSIKAKKPKISKSGGGIAVDIEVVASEPYAFRMHESLVPVGPLQLGKTSRAQPATREGNVGGKYLSRAVERNIVLWQNYLNKIVEQNMGRAAKTTKVLVKPLPKSTGTAGTS
jgi:hypothetical protein